MKVKGNSIYFIKKFIVETYGHDFYDRIIQDARNKQILEAPIISSEWYGLDVKQDLCERLYANVTKEEFKKCSRYEVEHQVKGLIKFIMTKLSLQFLISNLQMVWEKHFSGGKIAGKMDGDQIIIDISEFPGSEPFMLHIETYIKSMFELVTKKTYKSQREKIDGSTWKITLK